jgi:hypothetical protein
MGQDFFKIIDQKVADGDCAENTRRRMENPTCQQCLKDYQRKFPNRPFGIHCEGIYDERDYQELYEALKGTEDELPYAEIKALLDPVYWANVHIKLPDKYGDMQAFVARDYQAEILRCTARRKVDRCGRGLGKTSLGGIEELHRALTRKNYGIMVATPAKAQAQKWWDDLQQHIKNDAEIAGSVAQQRQAPYFMLRFYNGSTISIFTTGSTSGKDADTVRSQSPRRVRLDEQDLLNPGDYKAIMPLLRRFKESEFHGSSTPVGKRETFWAMCTQYPDYKEFWFPIMRHPDFNAEYEEAARREARTELVYQHEFLAEFGDLEAGVFKPVYVDAAKDHYYYRQCVYSPRCKYFLGVDWNGHGTGTRIRVVEYDPITKIRRCVDAEAVDKSTRESIEAIRRLNKRWHCEGINIDAGFGFVQDELLREVGVNSDDPDDKRLRNINVIDFGAPLITNRIVPKRDRTKYINDEDNELQRRTKPFMVEGTVMAFEAHLVRFSDDDITLEEQLRSYRVKTYSQSGYANTYEAAKLGDHDLDAFMLAMLAIEMKYGMFLVQKKPHLAAGMAHISSFGGTAVPDPGPGMMQQAPMAAAREVARAAERQTAGIPSRTPETSSATSVSATLRALYLSRSTGYVVPGQGRAMSPKGVPSRTITLQGTREMTARAIAGMYGRHAGRRMGR